MPRAPPPPPPSADFSGQQKTCTRCREYQRKWNKEAGEEAATGHAMRLLAHMWKSACASLGSARRSPILPASCGTPTSVQYAGGWEARAYRGIAEKLLWKSATLQVI